MTLVPVQEASPGAHELDRAVRTVLGRPEFAERELPGPLQWLVDTYRAAREALWRLLRDLDVLRDAEPVLGWLVWALVLAALAALLVLVVRLVVRGARAAWRRREPPDEPEAAKRGGAMRPATWEARAGKAAGRGRLRDAALALYRAFLLRLDERGVLTYDPSKTPGDYRRETAGESAPGDAIQDFLRRFEVIAFGGRDVSTDGFAALASAARDAGVNV